VRQKLRGEWDKYESGVNLVEFNSSAGSPGSKKKSIAGGSRLRGEGPGGRLKAASWSSAYWRKKAEGEAPELHELSWWNDSREISIGRV